MPKARRDTKRGFGPNAMLLRHTDAGGIGAPSAGKADFVGTKPYLSLGFYRTQNQQALHVDMAADGGRISATSSRMPARLVHVL